jgi:prevent-host-death family protein
MFHEVGAYDAKAKLSELLRAVALGERYTITVRGKPVADLVPSASADPHDVSAAVTAMRAFKKVRGVSTQDISDMISSGRK